MSIIYGERVRLRANEREDLPKFHEWVNDPDVTRHLALYLPMSMMDEEKWLESHRDPHEKPLSIEIRKGKGWKLAADGSIGLKGSIPCATMGGMKARGFPGGAAGVYQAVEAAIQLRGQAEANQVANAKFGLIQSLGGPASTAVSHILQRLD